uniref:Uncharacterized protein n=1 Tax=Arundo donax TaxID=35708 RepID=A0A0A9BTK9_ARUDO
MARRGGTDEMGTTAAPRRLSRRKN